MAMVIAAPRAMLTKGLEVIFFNRSSNLPPAIFSRLLDMTFMPNRKKARPPIREKAEKISIGCSFAEVYPRARGAAVGRAVS